MTNQLPKFESPAGDDWAPYCYPRVFVRERTTGPDRLKIAASERGADILLELAAVLGEPFSILYVLTVPRGGSPEGRYQSPWINRSELNSLVEEFGAAWEQDGRHHIWLFSGPDRATLVYDHHNVIFAYGPLDAFVRVLEHRGFSEAAEIVFPAPHRHQFHGDFDDHERKITQALGWQHSPLRDGDDY